MAHLFTAMVRARLNIVVCGGPAAGKTTLLRALAHAIPRHERLITIEDAYELALSREDHPDLVRSQTREPNIEGAGGYDMNRLIRASLRMTPDRVIVGEVRGAEVVPMAKAMSHRHRRVDGHRARLATPGRRCSSWSPTRWSPRRCTRGTRPWR